MAVEGLVKIGVKVTENNELVILHLIDNISFETIDVTNHMWNKQNHQLFHMLKQNRQINDPIVTGIYYIP